MPHTKGKWIYYEISDKRFGVIPEGTHKPICFVECQHDDNSGWSKCEQTQSNAQLIAAAPDLLEALENMQMMYRQWIEQDKETQGYKWADKALKAIAKAKGLKAIKKAKGEN